MGANKQRKSNTTISNNRKENLLSGITLRKDGRYLIRKQGNGLKLSKYAWTLEEALNIREEFIRRIESHKLDVVTKENSNKKKLSELTLKEVFEIYIENTFNIKVSTKSTYRQSWNTYLENSFLARMIVTDIKRTDVKRAYIEILNARDKDLSESSLKIINVVIKRCYEHINFEEDLNLYPTKGVLKKFRLPEKKEKTVITDDEIRLLIEFMTKERYTKYVNIFKFMILTGVRVGEMLAMTWDDIDFIEKKYIIQRSLHYRKLKGSGKYVLYVSSVKTKCSLGKITMTEELIETLLAEKKRQEDNNIVCNTQLKYLTDNGKEQGKVGNFIFVRADGKTYTEEAIRTAFLRVVRNCNKWEQERSAEEGREPRIVKEFTPHQTRHTALTRLMESGAGVKDIQEFARHADIKTTLGTYCHVSDTNLSESLSNMKRIS